MRIVKAATSNLDFSAKELTRLRNSIREVRLTKKGEEIKPKILIFGPTGAGKSSLCNGLKSALEGGKYVSSYFAVGATLGSFTKGFEAMMFGNNWIIDTGGIFDSRDISSESIENIASGKIPFYQHMDVFLKPKEKVNMPEPGENDVSCVVIVLAMGTEVPPDIKRMIDVIMDLSGKGVVAYRVVLTHIDRRDDKFEDPKQLADIYASTAIQKGVRDIANQTGVPPSAISVVRNYVKELDTDLHSNILLLDVLDRIVHAAVQQCRKKDVRAEMCQMYEKLDLKTD